VIQLVSGFVDLFKWNGSDFVATTSESTLVYSYPSIGPTIKVNASELGGVKTFNFFDSSGQPDLRGRARTSRPTRATACTRTRCRLR
jgi:hypothetical protein